MIQHNFSAWLSNIVLWNLSLLPLPTDSLSASPALHPTCLWSCSLCTQLHAGIGGGHLPLRNVTLPPLDPSPLLPKYAASAVTLSASSTRFSRRWSFFSADRPAQESPILAPWASDLPAPSQSSFSTHPLVTFVCTWCLQLLTRYFLSDPSWSNLPLFLNIYIYIYIWIVCYLWPKLAILIHI